ncbi:MAG: GNAT family N-acetyltransferase [Lachnospiraceae bacterium]|nr:GNAT family N-acetyltransferase [Lachnospiraceae bacterium]
MEITTERLILRPHGTKYLETTHKYASNYENTKYMMALPSDSLEATKEFLVGCENEWAKEKPSFYEFAIIKNEIHIGAVSFYLNDTYDTANIGWILDSDYHGFGYASEAASALVKYASEELGINHFVAFCDSENLASEGVMKKLGMVRVSLSRGRKNKGSDEERMEYMYEMRGDI